MSIRPIWLASYPRSGNTLLRTVLYQCFGFVSASIYSNDLGANRKLESYVGHIEHNEKGMISFPDGALPLFKTHELPTDDGFAIYVVRDGRAASVSLWEFYRRSLSLEAVIAGRHRFGTWANHLLVWQPWARPNSLLLKYEEILSDLPTVLGKISAFLDAEIINSTIPERETIADVDGQWVRKKSDWREVMTDKDVELFLQTNGLMMEKMGYSIARLSEQ